eukprot:3511226-Prymnesium_polylepis.1
MVAARKACGGGTSRAAARARCAVVRRAVCGGLTPRAGLPRARAPQPMKERFHLTLPALTLTTGDDGA